jgi:hypothetical protein
MGRRTSGRERTAEALATVSQDVLEDQHAVQWSQLSHGMPVRFRDGSIGTIDHLWLAPHTSGGQLIVRLAGTPYRCIVVPLNRVQFVDALGVSVDMDAVPVEALPAPTGHEPELATTPER